MISNVFILLIEFGTAAARRLKQVERVLHGSPCYTAVARFSFKRRAPAELK